MILKEFKLFFNEALSAIYPKTEIDSFFFILMEEKLKLQRIDTVLKPSLKLSMPLKSTHELEAPQDIRGL